MVVANTLFGPVLHSYFFDDAKRGKIKMTMLVLVTPWLSELS